MQRGRFEANPAATAAARETTGSGYDQRPDRERDTQCGTGSARYIVTLLRGRWSVPAVDRRPSRPASRRPAVRTRRPTLTRRKLGVAHEELLKLRRRWNHRREEPGKRGANVLPRVRRAPRNEDERARRRLELCIAELDQVKPLQRVDQLVLTGCTCRGGPSPTAASPRIAVRTPPVASAML